MPSSLAAPDAPATSPAAVAARRHIDAAAATLRRARVALDAAEMPADDTTFGGATFDGTTLEALVRQACAAVAGMPADEAAALKPALLAIVAELDELLADCARERDALRHRLADSGMRRRATSAYRGAR